MAWVTIWARLAPVIDSASTGPMSMSSMFSANSRPSMPTEWTDSARTPGKGPRPTAVTNSSAQTRSGTARLTAMTPRAARYSVREGVTLLAAQIASGSENNQRDCRAEQGDVDAFRRRRPWRAAGA